MRAAVYIKHFAGDIASKITGQEEADPRHIERLRDAPEGNRGHYLDTARIA
jgi:hypothetical protein